MKEELKIFENRSDDWYAKERAYEESVSAWDLDDGKRLKEEHRQIHSKRDISRQDFKNFQNRELSQFKKDSSQLNTVDQKRVVKIALITVLIMTFLPTILILFAGGISEDFIYSILALIFFITMALSSKQKGRRRR